MSVLKTTQYGPPQALISPTQAYELVSPNGWYSANNAASLTGVSRDDQTTEPADSASLGEYAFDPKGSVGLFKFVIRGDAGAIARGHVFTANLWEWSQVAPQAGSTGQLMSWTPTLVGRWTLTFNGTGSAANNTVGANGAAVLATDLYCSNIVVVATFDRRGDYALRWKIMQPAVEDGSPAVLLVDGLGSTRFSWEGRSTTAGDAWHVLARFTTSA